MSGTSLDGLDIALCSFNTTGQPQLIKAQTSPLPSSLRAQLSQLSQPGNTDELHLQAIADRDFAIFCAEQVKDFLAQTELTADHITAIGSHGQTVRHMPTEQPAYTVQLGCPSTLAALSGIDVIAQFRQKDIALGGQGAPIAPAFHEALCGSTQASIGILNIGGIANLTCLRQEQSVLGFDIGPGNCLLDSWFQHCHPQSAFNYDKDGSFANTGELNPGLLKAMLADAYFATDGPKSTGREYFNLAWLAQFAPEALAPEDVQRTLVELTAISTAQKLEAHHIDRCYVCGGGAHNKLMMSRLTALAAELPSGCNIATTDTLGVGPDWVEAIAFAWLAWCFVNRQPVNLASVTGASRNAILGGYFPAA